jgi:hypothetical protein
MEAEFISSATGLLQPILESSMIIAGHYVKACNRKTITSVDVQYAMKYAARNLVGKHVGTLFPEDEDDEEDDDEDTDDESVEEVDEDEEPFVKYSGEDKILNDINEAADTWDTWTPTNLIETMLKDSIDKVY